MNITILRFARTKEDKPQIYIMSEQQAERWLMSDSGIEGHYICDEIWCGDVEATPEFGKLLMQDLGFLEEL